MSSRTVKNKCLQSGKLFGSEPKVTISQGTREEFEKFYTKWFLKRSPVRVEATQATISAIDTPSIQTPKDMVFSQTSHKTQNLIQVIELDHLKAEKNQQVNESIASDIGSAMASHRTTGDTFTEVRSSASAVYLKSEPLDENEMIQDMDFEFFQNLPSFDTEPDHQHVMESVQKIENEALYKNTLNTPLSSQSWEALDTNSPSVQASLYKNTSADSLSPISDGFTGFDAKLLNASGGEDLIQCPEQFLDINSLPIVIGDLASTDISSWQATQSADWTHIHHTDYTKPDTLDKVPLITDDDSQDWKCMMAVMPREVENNNVVIEEYLIKDVGVAGEGFESRVAGGRGLSVNVSSVPSWHTDLISTPDVLRTVEQLEKQKFPIVDSVSSPKPWVPDDSRVAICEDTPQTTIGDYEPITPKSESHIDSEEDDHSPAEKRKRRRRHDSEDSDETYTPYTEETPRRKYRRRKSSIPIEEKIRALEGSQQQPKARRGRPPKRRESNISSVYSIDENSSTTSTHEVKYRELRDKNNEASKRSRMNRKLKELQMEKLADELEEKNNRLKVKADILEDMTKRLKNALMTAILQK